MVHFIGERHKIAGVLNREVKRGPDPDAVVTDDVEARVIIRSNVLNCLERLRLRGRRSGGRLL